MDAIRTLSRNVNIVGGYLCHVLQLIMCTWLLRCDWLNGLIRWREPLKNQYNNKELENAFPAENAVSAVVQSVLENTF